MTPSKSRPYRRLSLAVRRAVGLAGKNCPIRDVDGFDPPKVVGHGWHFTNLSGDLIRHPSAYRKKGWRNVVYHPSTVHIIVGRGWLIEQGLA